MEVEITELESWIWSLLNEVIKDLEANQLDYNKHPLLNEEIKDLEVNQLDYNTHPLLNEVIKDLEVNQLEYNAHQKEDANPFDKEIMENITDQFHHINLSPLKNPLLIEIAGRIRNSEIKNIIVMSGAGISTAAGIPDFRSPDSGLYHNLQKYNLPYAEAIFDIGYFVHNPRPFYTLAKELYPGQFKPTISHFFIKLLATKELLKRHYTQNIDTLERVAGIPDNLLVEAHGSFNQAHCINQKCKKLYKQEEIKEKIFNDDLPLCNDCNHFVKPDITFFGENLPEKFYSNIPLDFPKCDLLIVMGTSLTVQPFASLIFEVDPTVPRILINREQCGTDLPGGFLFEDNGGRDISMLGSCDQMCLEFAELLGWKEELLQMHSNS